MNLHEAALALGVETFTYVGPTIHDGKDERPVLDIAHDVLAATDDMTGHLFWRTGGEWVVMAPWLDKDLIGTFEECVTALAERFLASK